MKNAKKHAVREETDKYREKAGRAAFHKENESEFLDDASLEDDLIDTDKNTGDADIVNSRHPENQEWHAREKTNENQEKSHHKD